MRWSATILAIVLAACAGPQGAVDIRPTNLPGTASPPARRTTEELLATASKVTVGDDHRCLLADTGHVHCWGKNWQGQLGNGRLHHEDEPTLVAGLPEVVDVKAAGATTCALTRHHELYCFGEWAGWLDLSKELPPDSDEYGPQPVPPSHVPTRVATGVRDFAWSSISAAFCIIALDGRAKCASRHPEGDVDDALGKASRTLLTVIREDGEPLEGVVQIYPSGSHVCAVDVEHDVWCWGSNRVYEQPRPYHSERRYVRATRVSLAEDVARIGEDCLVTVDGRRLCWGLRWSVAAFVPQLVGECGLAPVVLEQGCTLSTLGRLRCPTRRGRLFPQLAEVELGPGAQVEASEGVICAVTQSHGAVCWSRADKKVLEGTAPGSWHRSDEDVARQDCPTWSDAEPLPKFPRRPYRKVAVQRVLDDLLNQRVSDEVQVPEDLAVRVLALVNESEHFARKSVGLYGRAVVVVRYLEADGSAQTISFDSIDEGKCLAWAGEEGELPAAWGNLLTPSASAECEAILKELGDLPLRQKVSDK